MKRTRHFDGRLRQRAALQVDGAGVREARARDGQHQGGPGGAPQQRRHLAARQAVRRVPVCAASSVDCLGLRCMVVTGLPLRH